MTRYLVGMALSRFRFILAREMGAPSEAAEELANVVADASDNLVTKHEHAASEARIREQIWRATVVVIGVVGALGATIIGLLIALLARGGF